MVRQGADSIRAWRLRHPGELLDLSRADLPGARLAGADLSGGMFAEATLAGADLSGANLRKATLISANLAGANLSGASLSGADLSKAVLSNANLSSADLSEADLRGATLSRANLHEANLEAADLRDALLAAANLSAATLTRANLEKAALGAANLALAHLAHARLLGADLKKADLTGANLTQAKLRLPMADEPGAHRRPRDKRTVVEGPHALFEGTRLREAVLRGVDLAEFDLSGFDLEGADLTDASLVRTDFSDTMLFGAKLANADMTCADMAGARVDGETVLKGAEVRDCVIDRFTLESLDDYGGLTKGDRMKLRIQDTVAALRSYYSGFWSWIHIAAVLLFVAPYLWFVVSRFAESTATGLYGGIQAGVKGNPFLPGLPEMQVGVLPLYEALARYVWNGGVGWQRGWSLSFWTFAGFCFSFLYNMLRLVMLWRTKEFELHEHTSGLPLRIPLDSVWGRLYKIAVYGFFINLGIVLLHTFHFMKTPVQFVK